MGIVAEGGGVRSAGLVEGPEVRKGRAELGN